MSSVFKHLLSYLFIPLFSASSRRHATRGGIKRREL